MKTRVILSAVGLMVAFCTPNVWAQQNGAVLRWDVAPVLTGFGPAPDGRLSAIFVGPATGEVVGLSTAYIPLDALRVSDDGTTLHFIELEYVTTDIGAFTNVMSGVVDIASLQFFESGRVTDASGAYAAFQGNVSHNNATVSDLNFVPGVMSAQGHLFLTPSSPGCGMAAETPGSSTDGTTPYRITPRAAGSTPGSLSWGRIKATYR